MDNILVDLTSQLIRFKTTTKDNVNIAAEYCANWLNRNEVKAEILENQGLKIVLATIGDKGPTIILNGHLDVVPGQTSDFYPRVIGNKLFGRGSYDMLGANAALLLLISELSKLTLGCKVILTLVPDEEVGGKLGTGFLVRKGIRGDIAICAEPTNLNIALQAKGVLQVNLEIEGIAAHGSRPWLGENAILKGLNVYKNIETLDFLKASSQYFLKPSLNLAKIHGGGVVNQVPDSCNLTLDIRYLPGQNPQHILENIKTETPHTKVTVISNAAPVKTNKNNIYLSQLRKDAETILGRPIKFFGQDGSADTRYFFEVGIPAVEFGPLGANHHGPDEYVEIDSLISFKDILKRFVMNLNRKGDENEAQ
ncbi:M20/M25/M40 family metallo-hydrolase [Metallumcola ferriviriculae]|uniref:M20/M25/M40 family metallo-hydrolase n=1 Tax=Metallumcola ferriviriculae TaxID=3039180 RepID=A0AAU0UJX3_9FIRM|nr:M20/M25/M40 family metallo-hydrolase [Desulfitibacteraceae bacterium MK1]